MLLVAELLGSDASLGYEPTANQLLQKHYFTATTIEYSLIIAFVEYSC